MSMTVDHVQNRGNSYRYRRKVPSSLKAILGKGEIVIPLGKTKAEVMRNYGKVHRDAEAILAAAWDEVKGVKKVKPTRTARELFEETTHRVRELLGYNPFRKHDNGPDDEDDWVMRDAVAEGIAAKYPADPKTGYPVGVSTEDTELVRVLYSPSLPEAPAPTVEDAKRLYLKDRFSKNPPTPKTKTKDEQRADRAIGHIVAALGNVPTIASLRRADARTVQTHMLSTINSPDTVERYLNDVRAIINHAIKEYDLTGVTNPFMGLATITDNKAEAARKKRKPFTAEQLRATRKRVLSKSRQEDLKLIWRLLEGTGCRLSEVTGLRVIDVTTEGDHPHIDVQWHDARRVKTEVSWRKVPLVGDALSAAQEALRLTRDSPMLFPKYGREGGGDAASAALMKHVRAITDDPKVVVHSLRHNMKDRLRKARVPKIEQDLILGHTMGGVGEDYGSDEVRLEVATTAMKKTFDL